VGLDEYWQKRNFGKTPEPRGRLGKRVHRERSFCVQKHAASHLHYDFRLELEGALKSWAVPKGPSLDPKVPRLAMQTEDHPLDYGDFEGVIPEGQYGGGTVLLWDRGTWLPLEDDPHQAIRKGKLKFELRGEKLHGAFLLARSGERDARAWRLMKLPDQRARSSGEIVDDEPLSVTTDRDLDEIARDRDRVWHSNRGEEKPVTPRRRIKIPATLRLPEEKPVSRVPTADAWLHEIAIDGLRALARVDRKPSLRDAWNKVISQRFPAVMRALRSVRGGPAVVAGTVAVLLPDGRTEPPAAKDPRAVFFADDLLFADGEDLRARSLEARKQSLADLIASSRRDAALRFVRHFDDHGAEVFDKACALGAPAVLARRRDKPYGEASRRIACGERTQAGVKPNRLSKPDKLLWRTEGVTKKDLAEYYVAIGDHIVPHVQGRPLTLVRASDAVEDGTTYLRHSKVWGPEALRRVRIAEKTKVGEYMIADDLPGVLGLVQMSIVEIHTWNVTYPDVERPDRIVLDLDPDPSVKWDRVVAAARLLRERLERIGLASFVKTTGGKGLHVVVPIEPRADWDEVLDFARAFSESIVHDDRASFTTAMPKERRRGKILIDYLRNNRTNTSIAAFSTRARPGVPVSLPVSWDELPRVDPSAFTLFTVPKILARRRRDPWRDYETLRRPLSSRSAISATRMSSSGRSPVRRRPTA